MSYHFRGRAIVFFSSRAVWVSLRIWSLNLLTLSILWNTLRTKIKTKIRIRVEILFVWRNTVRLLPWRILVIRRALFAGHGNFLDVNVWGWCSSPRPGSAAKKTHAAQVTGVFCQSAIESAQQDHATVVQSMLENKEAWVHPGKKTG